MKFRFCSLVVCCYTKWYIQHHRKYSLPTFCRLLESIPNATWSRIIPANHDCRGRTCTFRYARGEAELVEGWWTEYGGMRFGMLFMAEYIRTYAACFLFTHFFLGGWHLPFQGLISQVPILGDLYL